MAGVGADCGLSGMKLHIGAPYRFPGWNGGLYPDLAWVASVSVSSAATAGATKQSNRFIEVPTAKRI